MPIARKRTAACWIFEGVWWRAREVPLVLPFLQALQGSDGGLSLSHKTFRSADDLRYWFRRIPKNERAFIYIACHADRGDLQPVDGRSRIRWDELLDALRMAKENAIEFLHFGGCEIVEEGNRRGTLKALADASGARWVSGYTREVHWLPAMLLDLAVVGELFLDFHHGAGVRRPILYRRAQTFLRTYEQFARGLGFSGLVNTGARGRLVPARMHG